MHYFNRQFSLESFVRLVGEGVFARLRGSLTARRTRLIGLEGFIWLGLFVAANTGPGLSGRDSGPGRRPLQAARPVSVRASRHVTVYKQTASVEAHSGQTSFYELAPINRGCAP